jgi:hypothetical protein
VPSGASAPTTAVDGSAGRPESADTNATASAAVAVSGGSSSRPWAPPPRR